MGGDELHARRFNGDKLEGFVGWSNLGPRTFYVPKAEPLPGHIDISPIRFKTDPELLLLNH